MSARPRLGTRFLIPKNFGREWSKSRGRREAGTAPLHPGGRPGNPELRRKRFPKKFWEGGPQSEKSTCEVTAPLHRAGMFLGERYRGAFPGRHTASAAFRRMVILS